MRQAQIKLLLILIVLCTGINQFSVAAEQLYTKQPSVTPELANPGKYSVGVTTINVTNTDQLSSTDFISRQDRNLTLEVWYPAEAGAQHKTATYKNVTRSGKQFELAGNAFRDADTLKSDAAFPLIVLSHGYTGYRTIMFYLGEHLASHGYIVAAIDHTDSTNAEVAAAKNPGAGFISTLMNRSRDQQFVMNYFAGQISDQHSALAKISDATTAAVVGYSMGGYGALNTVGGCYTFSAASLEALGIPADLSSGLVEIFNICSADRETTDTRWKAMVAIAPWGGEIDAHDVSKISLPTLFISGDQDDVSGHSNGVEKLWRNRKSKNNYLMVYENARHNIAAHPAPKISYASDFDIGHYFEASWNSETISRVNQHMSLAFLNCHVKNLEDACTYLPEHEDITQNKQADGSMTPAWPGFAERWGTGIRFYQK